MNQHFKAALAAKEGVIKPDQLKGAARRLYRDLTKSELKAYVAKPKKRPPRPVGRPGGPGGRIRRGVS